ncbi:MULTISPECIES: CHAT domain-containing tetratricopeptide repeat protein [unclassified Tolypothrix]|nr:MULTISPECIES: CHAT domain-containing tetratricopeptide repeat protein [unclassified Tolypothrix]
MILLLTISKSYGVNYQVKLLGSTAIAQTTNDRKAEADRLLEQGIKQFEMSQLKEALQSWENSLAIYREIGDRQGEAASLGSLGNAYYSLGDYPKAIDYLQQSLVITKEIKNRLGEAASLGNLGIVYDSLGDYRKAIDYYQQSLAIAREIKNRLGEAASLGSLGNAYYRLGDYRKAIDYHQQSFAIEKEIGNRLGIAQSLETLGNVYYSLGDYRKAIDYHNQSLTIKKEIGNRLGEAASLGSLGNVYYILGDYRKAIDYHQQSLAIFKEIGSRQGEATSLNSLGNAYHKLKDYHKAIDYHLQSLAISKEIGNRQGEADTLANIGLIYLELKSYDKSFDYLKQSLAIAREIKNRQGEATSLNSLGNVYYSLGDYHKAIDYHLQSLAICKEIGNRQGEADTLANIGLIYLELKSYDKSFDYLKQSLAIAEKIQDTSTKTKVLEAKVSVLHNRAALLRDSGKLAEAAKILYEAISWCEEIRKVSGKDDRKKIVFFERQYPIYTLLQEVEISRGKTTDSLIVSDKAHYPMLTEILIEKSFKNTEIQQQTITLSNDKIQKIVKFQNATIVQYSVIKNKENQIYIWVISPQGKIQFRFVNLPKDASLQELVKFSRESIGVRGNTSVASFTQKDNPSNRLRELHKLLIEPIEDLLPQNQEQRVIFIPHQELFLVPFVALQNGKNQYLIEKHTILTAPSIQALSLTQKDKQAEKKSNIPILIRGEEALIVGNPTMPKQGVGKDLKPLESLPGAEEEAKKIAQILGTNAIIGEQATESAIVQKMASAKLIHFATHGLLDGITIDSPGAIALNPSVQDDGFLTTSEIMEHFAIDNKQNLQAEFVVLSACDTGRGDIKGEGVIGLSRAFMASGVPTLVVSLWKVSDGDTVKLMTEFYTNFYEHKFDKAKAMRKAMLSMLKDDNGNPDPKAWAAFTVIGKAE